MSPALFVAVLASLAASVAAAFALVAVAEIRADVRELRRIITYRNNGNIKFGTMTIYPNTTGRAHQTFTPHSTSATSTSKP